MAKKTKKRDCPAAGEVITSAECGSGRHRKYACPPDCGYNPFGPGQYDEVLAIEEKLDNELMRWSVKDKSTTSKGIGLVKRLENGQLDEDGFSREMSRLLLFVKDSSGQTPLQKWYAQKEKQLKNDDRLMSEGKLQIRPVLLETVQIVDEKTLMARDLIAGEDSELMRFVDRASAARLCRFDVWFTLIFPLPHYHRLHGSAIQLTRVNGMTPREVFLEMVRHLGGPVDALDTPAGREWLGLHYNELYTINLKTGEERNRRMLEQVDFQSMTVDYAFRGDLSEARDRLLKAGCLEDNPDSAVESGKFQEKFLWTDKAGTDRPDQWLGGIPCLGAVYIGPESWRLEAIAQSRMDVMRPELESLMGEALEFTGERVEELGRQMAMEAGEPSEEGAVPPLLLENIEQVGLFSSRLESTSQITKTGDIAILTGDAYGKYADQALPALDGKTPRQAAADPSMRGRCLTLVKGLVNRVDHHNLEAGSGEDINWLIRELGLSEIDYPAPPHREPLLKDVEEEETSQEFLDPDVLDTLEDIIAMRREDYPFEDAILDDVKNHGWDLVEDLVEILAEFMPKEMIVVGVSPVLDVWLVLVSKGKTVSVSYELLEDTFYQVLETVDRILKNKKLLSGPNPLYGLCRSPELLALCMSQFLEDLEEKLGETAQPDWSILSYEVFLLSVINILIDEQT